MTDDTIVTVPPKVVFPAMKTLAKDVKEACVTKFRPDKSKAYSNKEHKPINQDNLQGKIDDGYIKDADCAVHHGLADCNIPIDHLKYAKIYLKQSVKC